MIRILDKKDAVAAYAPIKREKRLKRLRNYYQNNKEAQLERNRKPEYQAKQKEYLKGYMSEYMKKYKARKRAQKAAEREKISAEMAQKENFSEVGTDQAEA